MLNVSQGWLGERKETERRVSLKGKKIFLFRRHPPWMHCKHSPFAKLYFLWDCSCIYVAPPLSSNKVMVVTTMLSRLLGWRRTISDPTIHKSIIPWPFRCQCSYFLRSHRRIHIQIKGNNNCLTWHIFLSCHGQTSQDLCTLVSASELHTVTQEETEGWF